jgi:hypothetical protein
VDPRVTLVPAIRRRRIALPAGYESLRGDVAPSMC